MELVEILAANRTVDTSDVVPVRRRWDLITNATF
jgi:hypothetical protein